MGPVRPKSHRYLQKPSISAKEPYISAKEPYISAKAALDIRKRDPYFCRTALCFCGLAQRTSCAQFDRTDSAKEPYVSQKSPISLHPSLSFLQKSRRNPSKSPIFLQKIFNPPKSLLCLQKRCVFLCISSKSKLCAVGWNRLCKRHPREKTSVHTPKSPMGWLL